MHYTYYSIVLLVKVPIFQVANLIPFTLVWTSFFTCSCPIKWENLYSLNNTVGHRCTVPCPFNISRNGHIVLLITGNTLSFRVNFEVSEFMLRGGIKFLMGLAITNLASHPRLCGFGTGIGILPR